MTADLDKNVETKKADEQQTGNAGMQDKPSQKQTEPCAVIKTTPHDEHVSDNNGTSQPTSDASAAPAQNSEVAATAKRIAKKQKILLIVSAAVMIIILLYTLTNTAMCDTSPSVKGITVIEEKLVTDISYAVIGDSLFPILLVKVKNNSSSTKKVSFEANFYADGELLGEDQASYVTLGPGDEAVLMAQSDRGYKAWTQHEYSYKITKWWIYTP